MKEVKVNEAIKYANATNKIEDMDMTKEELTELKDAILKDSDNKSFLYNLVNKLKKREEKKDVKNRR